MERSKHLNGIWEHEESKARNGTNGICDHIWGLRFSAYRTF